MKHQLRVHSIETMTTQDGPGVRFLLFLQGCHFRCLYCQNPDSQDVNGGELMDINDLTAKILRYKSYYRKRGGITVSGGEPTLQATNLILLFKKLRSEGLTTALDSNGYITTDIVKELYKVTDLLLLDVKHIDEQEHIKLTGKSNINTLEMAKYRESLNMPMWLRYVLVPGINDSVEYLERWGQHFKDYKNIQRVEILPFHQLGKTKWKMLNMDYKLKDLNPPSAEIKNRTKKIFDQYFDKVTLN